MELWRISNHADLTGIGGLYQLLRIVLPPDIAIETAKRIIAGLADRNDDESANRGSLA